MDIIIIAHESKSSFPKYLIIYLNVDNVSVKSKKQVFCDGEPQTAESGCGKQTF